MSDSSTIPEVIGHHCDESGSLWMQRQRSQIRPDMSLIDLSDLDWRLDAHLDGLRIGGQRAWRECKDSLADGTAAAVFTATVLALETKGKERLATMCALAEANPEVHRGFASAFGWVSPADLRGVSKRFLMADSAFLRWVGVVSCAQHRVDPGEHLPEAARDSDLDLRARAIRAAGELGRVDMLRDVLSVLMDTPSKTRVWAAWSAVLLGNRGSALDELVEIARRPGIDRLRAFRLAFQTMSVQAAHAELSRQAQIPEYARWVVQGAGLAGDPVYVPWLINLMADDQIARLAGEAFGLITGADLVDLRLDRTRPEGFESGPNDDPDDDNVEMDPDEGLPWPDEEGIKNWWMNNRANFQAGNRYFLGAPVAPAHCIGVLNNGYQRQRILAAQHLCLLNPGIPLFEWRAPAWRQQKVLPRLGL
jgi:uncharacterized protein (TIGR02270 family)